jgi:MoxR-like ATPase
VRFEGTKDYVATDDLKVAVNAAVTLRRPLLVKGEPGTGKTVLAHEIAEAAGAPLIEWHVKSTTKAHQGLYEYEAVARLRDGQLGDPRVHDIANYIRRRQAVGGVHLASTARPADRRDRQGRYRIPERSAPGTRSHGIPCLRDWRDGGGQRAADRHHHVK